MSHMYFFVVLKTILCSRCCLVHSHFTDEEGLKEKCKNCPKSYCQVVEDLNMDLWSWPDQPLESKPWAHLKEPLWPINLSIETPIPSVPLDSITQPQETPSPSLPLHGHPWSQECLFTI